jgi:phage shock protein PspC (stress-responsive transcriptional regulator)
MRVQLRTILVVIAVLLLGLPAAARANGAAVIRDCARDGVLNKHYSQKDLRSALNNLPSDIDEYTDCRSVIQAAMGGGSGNHTPAPPNGILTPSGAVAATSSDVKALHGVTSSASKGRRPAIDIGGKNILPGNAGLSGVLGGLAGSNGMPAPLIAAIVALLVLAAVTAYLAAREKVPLLKRAALRVLGR